MGVCELVSWVAAMLGFVSMSVRVDVSVPVVVCVMMMILTVSVGCDVGVSWCWCVFCTSRFSRFYYNFLTYHCHWLQSCRLLHTHRISALLVHRLNDSDLFVLPAFPSIPVSCLSDYTRGITPGMH